MPRPATDTVTLCCPLSETEQDFAAEMMRMTGVTSDGNLVRLGLYHLARHLDLPIGNSIFAQRKTHGLRPSRTRERQLTLEEIA